MRICKCTNRICGETPGLRRICGWCTCKFSWPKFQKMGFTAHHSASYVYPSMIWWGIFFFPFWQRIYGLRFRAFFVRDLWAPEKNRKEVDAAVKSSETQMTSSRVIVPLTKMKMTRLRKKLRIITHISMWCSSRITFLKINSHVSSCARNIIVSRLIQRKFRLRAKVAHEMTWMCRRCFLPYVPDTFSKIAQSHPMSF